MILVVQSEDLWEGEDVTDMWRLDFNGVTADSDGEEEHSPTVETFSNSKEQIISR